MERKRKCYMCKRLTYDWEAVNGGPVRCWNCGRNIREYEAYMAAVHCFGGTGSAEALTAKEK